MSVNSLLPALLSLTLACGICRADAIEQCLQDKLKTAPDAMPIGDLRLSCRTVEALEQAQSATVQQLGEESAVTRRLIAEQRALDNPFEISSYRRNYVLLADYNDSPNTDIWALDHPEQSINHTEVKFQLSLKALVARGVLGGDLWAAYTQQSWWQLYAKESAPFRETNYEPELFVRWDSDLAALNFNLRAFTVGYTHESNGRSGEFSRSWNRITSTAVFDRGNLVLIPRIWWRIPEQKELDDNPDMDDYLGVGDLAVAYKWDKLLFTTTLKSNFQRVENRTSFQLDMTFPLNDRFKGYIQYYNGYGESLIDYDHHVNRIGVGVLLNDWM